MFSQQSNTSVRLGSRKGSRQSKNAPLRALMGIGLVAAFASFLVLIWTLGGIDFGPQTRAQAHKRPIPQMGNTLNAVALDVITSLDCERFNFAVRPTIYDTMHDNSKGNTQNMDESNKNDANPQQRHRRLANSNLADDINYSEKDVNENQREFGEHIDYGYTSPTTVTGRELFCLVAGSEKVIAKHQEEDAREGAPPRLQCDALDTRREGLLTVWSSARSQMTLKMIKNVLDLSVEKSYNLSPEITRHFWAPFQDESLDLYVENIASKHSRIRNLDVLQKEGVLFVDIGSGLGVSTLAVSLLYPEATVLSVEPAMPSWLLQRINLVCNLEPDSKMPHPIMSGVGPKNDGMLKMMWRPASTGATRTWTPHDEKTAEDTELIVRLRTLHSILAEAAANEDIDSDVLSSVVLNIDCEGCEYNIIPAMSDVEFNAIDIIVGTNGMHWGYIPEDKRPSSSRGSSTHERLCIHYDFARQSIECCAFPDLRVRLPGHPPVSSQNRDLCANFKTWADEKKLFESTDDYGWTELTSMA